MVFSRKGLAKYSTTYHILKSAIYCSNRYEIHNFVPNMMKDEFQLSKNLCIAAAMVLPLSTEQQG